MLKEGKGLHQITDTYCRHKKGEFLCACLSIYRTRNMKKYAFSNLMLKDLSVINSELRSSLDPAARKTALEKYREHAVVEIALKSRDSKLTFDNYVGIPRPHFLAMLYECREYYGLTHSFEQKELAKYGIIIAQGPLDFVKSVITTIYESLTCENIRDVLKTVANKVLSSVSYLLEMVSSSAAKTIAFLIDKVIDMILSIFDPARYLEGKFYKKKMQYLYILLAAVFFASVMSYIGFMSVNFVIKLIKSAGSYARTLWPCRTPVIPDEVFEATAHGPSVCSPLAAFLTTTAVIIGAKTGDVDHVVKSCVNFSKLVSFGIAGSFFIGSLVLILPSAVRLLVMRTFGSDEEQDKALVDEWISRSVVAFRMRKVPRVLVSEDYRKLVADLIVSSRDLRARVKTPHVAALMNRQLVCLVEVASMLEQYFDARLGRDLPYCFHISGPPGVGKTLFGKKLMYDVFGKKDCEVFSRSASTEFWDGYINQSAVMYDEFQIGPKDNVVMVSMEYLELVSTKTFTPSMASVDNPTVGIKGTPASPDVVVTINNSDYVSNPAVPDSAMWRRRKYVLRLSIKPEYLSIATGRTLDFNNLTVEEISKAVWLDFTILPAEQSNVLPLVIPSYDELVVFMQDSLYEHQQACARVKLAMSSDVEDTMKSPREMIDDALREILKVPNESVGVMESFLNMFSFTAQGPLSVQDSKQQRMNKTVVSKPGSSGLQVKPVDVFYERLVYLQALNSEEEAKTNNARPRMLITECLNIANTPEFIFPCDKNVSTFNVFDSYVMLYGTTKQKKKWSKFKNSYLNGSSNSSTDDEKSPPLKRLEELPSTELVNPVGEEPCVPPVDIPPVSPPVPLEPLIIVNEVVNSTTATDDSDVYKSTDEKSALVVEPTNKIVDPTIGADDSDVYKSTDETPAPVVEPTNPLTDDVVVPPVVDDPSTHFDTRDPEKPYIKPIPSVAGAAVMVIKHLLTPANEPSFASQFVVRPPAPPTTPDIEPDETPANPPFRVEDVLPLHTLAYTAAVLKNERDIENKIAKHLEEKEDPLLRPVLINTPAPVLPAIYPRLEKDQTPYASARESSYSSADESNYSYKKAMLREVEKKHSVSAPIAHIGIDPTQLHTHRCIYVFEQTVLVTKKPRLHRFQCRNVFIHSHPTSQNGHSLHCELHKDFPESYDVIHNAGGPSVMRDHGLIPSDAEFAKYEQMTEFEKDIVRAKLRKVAADHLKTVFCKPGMIATAVTYTDPNFDEDENCATHPGFYALMKDYYHSYFGAWIGAAVCFGVYVLVKTVKKIVCVKEEIGDENVDEVCFSHSPPPQKVSRGKPSRTPAKWSAPNFPSAHGKNEKVRLYIGDVLVNCVPIKGSTLLTYYHALCEDGVFVERQATVELAGKRTTFKLTVDNVRIDESKDLALITFYDKQFQSFPDISKKFITCEELRSVERITGVLEKGDNPIHLSIARSKGPKSYTSKGFTKKICLESSIMYNATLSPGDCGLIVRSTSQIAPGKILGIHVAGGNTSAGPFGLATIVTREDIDATFATCVIDESEIDACEAFEQGPVKEGEDVCGTGVTDWMVDDTVKAWSQCPNFLKHEIVPKDNRVQISRKSKLKPSIIAETLESRNVPLELTKFPPLMTATDPRGPKTDPINAMILDTLDKTRKVVDDKLVEVVADSTFAFYLQNLTWPVEKRHLTFEEALQGIPGILASMKVASSAGYPYVLFAKKSGKSDFYRFDALGDLHYEPWFKDHVLECYEQFLRGDLENVPWLVYLKDELVSQKKIDEGRTRIVYGGNIAHQVVFRMVFGSLIAAMNNSWATTSSAIGLNQYSYDMDTMHDYLTEVGNNFVAGDLKNFDKNMPEEFQINGYRILFRLLGSDLIPPSAQANFLATQMQAPAQFGTHRIWFKNTHYSGCLFTSILNNLVHEMYLRYTLMINAPDTSFEQNVRLKVLGDDHIYCFSDEVKNAMTPWKIRDTYATFGQTYTSDIKDADLEDRFRPFDEITFLGAHPTIVLGRYSGAMKKSTLREQLLWTRNNNNTIEQEINTVIELSSAWGSDFYYEQIDYYKSLSFDAGLTIASYPGYLEMAERVANRTASKSGCCYGFFAHGPEPNMLTKETPQTTTFGKVLNDCTQASKRLMDKSINALPGELALGPDSMIPRLRSTWDKNAIAGKAIVKIDIPFGLINNPPQNIQDMPFSNFTYFNGDVVLTLDLTGNPFCSGKLCMYFMPLCSYEAELANIPATNHVIASAHHNSKNELTIPFFYLRSAMNTLARDTESLGTVFITPLTPLRNDSEIDQVSYIVFSQFKNSQFTIPRTLTTSTIASPVTNYLTANGNDNVYVIESDVDTCTDLIAHGNSSSTTINNSISNVGGVMPIEGFDIGGDSSATQDISADAKIPVGFDNPPLSNGTIPVKAQLFGMSTSEGIRSLNNMQLVPTAMAREAPQLYNVTDTKFESLMSHRLILTTIEVNNTMPAGTQLLKIRLDTRLGLKEGDGIPLSLVVMNQFMFWKSDILFELDASMTDYHAVRLQAVTAYGAADITPEDRNGQYSTFAEFGKTNEGSNHAQKILVPFNAATSHLRTYEGEKVLDPNQNYSIGMFGIYTATKLTAPDTVSPTVPILVRFSFVNPKIAVPRAISAFYFDDYNNFGKPYYYLTWSVSLNMTATSDVWTMDPNEGEKLDMIPQTSQTRFFLVNEDQLSRTITYRTANDPTTLRTGYINPDKPITYNQTTGAFTFSVTSPGSGTNVKYFLVGKTLVLELAKRRITEEMIDESEIIAHGHDIEVAEVEVNGSMESNDAPETTATARTIPPIPVVPHKLNLGEKFEYTPTDVIEILRRYVQIFPRINSRI
nr:MAG: RNA-dependent RNA polymerase [Riboviria sp.]